MANFKLVQLTTEEQKQIEDPYSYFIYPKTQAGEALKADIDEALRTLQQNGTYTELGLKYYGYDTANRK
jgi:ABC-type amino acid transport substrate-binding protein